MSLYGKGMYLTSSSSFVLPIINILKEAKERSKPMHIDSSSQEDEESQASENDTQMNDDAL